ncbi:hypothetical protein [Chitiniphilus eburneus]|uniref:hypothetical protein n=1 Tax=Chitiniphilus eburneus TaxID=2571148 RepID=UPI00145F046C|nr:hypothetical protein [Chitiniphilus eburneus]
MHTRIPSLLLSAALLVSIVAALTLHKDPIVQADVAEPPRTTVALAGARATEPPPTLR